MSEQVQERQDQQIPDPVLTPVGLPDTDSADGALDINAKVLWSMVRYTELDTPLRPSLHAGEEGYLWNGRMSSVVADLWPIMRNPGERTRAVRVALAYYLKITHNMVCLDKGFGPVRKGITRKAGPLWWVRADWNDRAEFFKVTSTWPERGEADDQDEMDAAYAAETDDPTEPDTADGAGVKVYVCDYPGCDEGLDGGPFTNTRANVMPMHRKAHQVTNNIVAAMAKLMSAPGADVPHITLADVAREAGVYKTSVNQRFTREQLLARATALLAEQGATSVDVSGATEYQEKLLRLAALAAYNGTPLSLNLLSRAMVGVSRETREALVYNLVQTKALVQREVPDAVNRPVDVYVNADPAVLARALNVTQDDLRALADLLSEAQPAPQDPAPQAPTPDPVVDYIQVLRDFLVIAEGREAAIREREAVIARQGAQLDELTARDTSQRELIQEARTELRTLKELIAPLANVARDAES